MVGTLAFAGAATAAGAVRGDWVTQRGARVRVAACGDGLCGTLVGLPQPLDPVAGQPQKDTNNPDPALRERPRLGIQIIKGMRSTGGGRWSGGRIYDPQTGKTFDSRMSLNPDGTLTVEGCIAIICQAQAWTPAN